jgi:membrane protein DedA with SNARE-associated domain
VLDRFLEWVAQLPELAVYLVLMALSAIENVFPPAPADVAVVLGAFLAQHGLTSAPLLGVLCWLSNTASSVAMFFYARRRGRAFFETGWRSKLMPPDAMAAIEKAYARHGVLGIFISRFLPGIRAAVTPFAGIVGMSPMRALLPAAAASAIWYAVLVGFGSFLGVNWKTARHIVDDANRVLAVISVVITVAIVWWLWRRRRQTHEE